MNSISKNPRLLPGDLIGLVAPGSPPSEDQIDTAIQNMESLGFKVHLSEFAKSRHGYLAGTDTQRLNDLHAAFVNPKIKAVWCIRGGYGTPRLLPQIDYSLIRKNPKPLIGYSDITALLIGLYQKAGIPGFHGPNASSTLNDFNKSHLAATLLNPQSPFTIQAKDFSTIRPGQAEGRLIGGNLSLLASLCGTKYAPSFKNKIVFIEDIGEKPYRIDRMLTQLRQSTHLSKAAGIVLGHFKNCEAKPNESSLSLIQTLEDRLGDLDIPVVLGMPFGHIDHQVTLPLGIKTRFDASAGSLTFLETLVH